jgi:hypothetical protein
LGRYGGGGSTEGAVLRGLRWLKKTQEPDGNWNPNSGGGDLKITNTVSVGLTGLALLTFAGHGETDASPEFGETVKKAVAWLLKQQAPDGSFGSKSYEHPIATFSLCEIHALTPTNSALAPALTNAVKLIVSGRNVEGGWDYAFAPTRRTDTSITGWCVQALKAAQVAGLGGPDVDKVLKKALEALLKNYAGDDTKGRFSYAGSTDPDLTGIGVLCCELIDYKHPLGIKGALAHLSEAEAFTWENVTWEKIYRWHFATQAFFHVGGELWKSWNKQFCLRLVKAQAIESKAIEGPAIDGPGGRRYDIGYWDANNPKGGRVMDTALCILMLEVYYRYPPVFFKPRQQGK